MIDAIITRLKEEGSGLKSVKGAVDMANIMDSQFNVPFNDRPAAFVMLAEEQASPNELDTGGVAQIVTESVLIGLCVGEGSTAGKAVAADAIKIARDAVMNKLLAWSPDGLGVFVYGGLQLTAFKPRAVWFQMVFSRRVGVGA